MAVLKRRVYLRQCDEQGRLRPGNRAEWQNERARQQAQCPRPEVSLQRGGDQRALYASCSLCGLKRVILSSGQVLPVCT